MDFFCTSWSKGWCLLFHVMKWKWQAYSITDHLCGCEQNVCRLYFSWTRESLSNMLKALYIATILFLKTYLTWFSWYHLPCSFKIFINVYALLYVKVNSKKICEEVSIPSFFRKILLSAFLLRFKQAWSQKKCVATPTFVDSNSPCKDLLFPQGPNLAQKPLFL